MCDVGQGDATVLAAGDGTAVVVDAGPDPRLVDRCLRDLGVTRIPLLLLTHFHADHVAGLPGVLHGRAVGAIETTALQAPAGAERPVPTERQRLPDVPLAPAGPGGAAEDRESPLAGAVASEHPRGHPRDLPGRPERRECDPAGATRPD